MKVFVAECVYPGKHFPNEGKKYGPRIGATFVPNGEELTDETKFYINEKPDSHDGKRLKALKKGQKVVVVECYAKSVYYKLADLSEELLAAIKGGGGAPKADQAPRSTSPRDSGDSKKRISPEQAAKIITRGYLAIEQEIIATMKEGDEPIPSHVIGIMATEVAKIVANRL